MVNKNIIYLSIFIILIVVLIIQQFVISNNNNDSFKNEIKVLHRKNDSLMSNIIQRDIQLYRLDSITNCYKLEIQQDKLELAKLQQVADKNKKKYNEEHNRILSLTNSAAASEFTEVFK